MDHLQRIYKLHQILTNCRFPVSRKTLEARLECSPATVKRLIDELRLYFNAPLEYNREHNGYFYDTQREGIFELPGLWFNANELYALLTVQQLLQQTQPGLLDDYLKPIKNRLEKILATVQLNKDEIAKRIRILRMTARNTASEHFQSVASALLQRKRLHIHYHGRSDDQTSQREVSPQRLTHYRDNWYLDAYCHKRNALRSFAVDRIRACHPLDQVALEFDEVELDAHFASSYGIFAGQPQATAVLLFSPERARWVADEQWHSQQQGKLLPDGSYELSIPYANSKELVMDILKHGAGVEVLEPAALRQEVINRLEAAIEKYG
ncbi:MULTISPECIES: helix-turn-helix transcriptional regulator [Nitrosomonas]|uniref:Transcriptional regulator n=1 Tax=Nitrosomonas communis TaxID=44574 RepID=A0A0F7KJE4_9PROT|nr:MULTISPECIES: WYL domain-containing protein [Nitrosomonas]AKH38887.1 transcriptional regulator [Nitrosomonas communis]TYP91894.1 putative DNA-binding transcriptional regulator YafY [Nitrosomonas communis]UVS61022.1 WYL domain-containing protein [Nitrosomonas sp. PLL12]